MYHVVYCSRNPERLSEQKAAAVVLAAESFKEKELLYTGNPTLALQEASKGLQHLGDQAVAAAIQAHPQHIRETHPSSCHSVNPRPDPIILNRTGTLGRLRGHPHHSRTGVGAGPG